MFAALSTPTLTAVASRTSRLPHLRHAVRPRQAVRPRKAAPLVRAYAPGGSGRYTAPASAAGSVIVEVCSDEAAVASYLCGVVEAVAVRAIAARGLFTLAIPGGSVLKALAGLRKSKSIDWDKVRLFFVDHKCVPNYDASASSFAKAKKLFLDAAGAPATSVAALTGSDDPEAEAAAYAAALRAAAMEAGMELAPSGAPRFDLVLLGVGSDGHVGSLYPEGKALDRSGQWVLPVVKSKAPASITLGLPVLNAGRIVVVCLTGASKAAAAKLALETPVPAGDFPAQLVHPDLAPAIWLLDEAAASQLSLVHGAVAAPAAAADATYRLDPAPPAAPAPPARAPAVWEQVGPSAGRLLHDGSILYSF